MNRRRLGFTLFSLMLVVACGGGALWWGLVQVPDFYQQALTVNIDPQARMEAARAFEQQTLNLADDVKRSDAWSEEFTEQQVNAWLAESLPRKHGNLIPKGVSEPRVRFADGLVLVGFRYTQKNFNGVVSLGLRPWVPEPNQLAIEIQWIKAGAVPVPLEKVLDGVSKQFATGGLRTEWRQSNGNEVLIVHFESREPNQPVLEAISVHDGRIKVGGSHRPGAGAGAGGGAGGRSNKSPERPVFKSPRIADRPRT